MSTAVVKLPPIQAGTDAARIRATIAATKQKDPDADTTELQRDLKAARAEDFVRSLVDGAPALNQAQRSRLAALLAPSEGA